MADLVVANHLVKPGSRAVVSVPVTLDICMPVAITAHVVAGVEPGPTLLLLSMLHGNEWFSVLILRELIRRLDPAALCGNVIAVPVANPSAMMTGTRCILDDSDEPDANRSFGGTYRWLSNQITTALADHFLPIATHLIDYHVSDWGSTMADVSFVEDYSDPRLAERSQAMALAYGFPVLHALRIFSGPRGARTSLGFAGERFGIPGIVAEVGGLGFGEPLERTWLARNVDGTLGVMRHLGMLSGTPPPVTRYLLIHDYWRVSPRVGGYLEPTVGLDRQFQSVAPDELLGRVISPTTFDVIDELRCPGEGTLFYTCRSYMIRPGAWAFGVANMEDGHSRWIAPPGAGAS